MSGASANAAAAQAAQLELIAEMAEAFAEGRDLDATLRTALERITRHVGAEAGSLFLLDPTGRRLVCHASIGPVPITGLTLSANEGIVGRTVCENACELVRDVRRDGDHLLVRYEEWSLLRPIYMDGRPQPTHRTPSLLGHSVGRIENGALIVETTRVTPDLLSDSSQVGHSGELTAVERYTVHDNPRRLELTLTLTDPVTFTKPLVVTKTWLATPDVELVKDSCSQQPGKP